MRRLRCCGENTALGDFIQFVRDYMLTIETASKPTDARTDCRGNISRRISTSPSMATRTDAETVVSTLERIDERARVDEAYLLPGGSMERRWYPSRESTLRRLESRDFDHLAAAARLQISMRGPDKSDVFGFEKNVCEFGMDNAFAVKLASRITNHDRISLSFRIEKMIEPRICGECSDIDINDLQLRVSYPISYLETSSSDCDLCALFYKAAVSSRLPIGYAVGFVREKWLLLNITDGSPALSIVKPPEENNETVFSRFWGGLRDYKSLAAFPSWRTPRDYIQLGFLQPPEPGGTLSMELARQWLDSCNSHHTCMKRPVGSSTASRLPARLLNVGIDRSSTIRLEATASMSPALRYMALSFTWGSVSNVSRTIRGNLAEFERSIKFDKLSKTFQDAISVTRQLGVQFLWIDSLCIIQDAQKDWESHAESVENIFGNAYCVLAACSSLSAKEGFLQHKQERSVVPMKSPGAKPLFLCDFIDDFKRDVEQSHLGSRGWAFQERILARRTIFFTSKQVYWQCGEGVYSATLGKMSKCVRLMS